MPKMESQYLGQLRTQATHLPSANQLVTDAPVDNNGLGQAFSPTDLVATALGSCMMTIMGIWAQNQQVSLAGAYWQTEKIMSSSPRRISKVLIRFYFPSALQISELDQKKLMAAAKTCPVALSLHQEITQEIHFDFNA